MRKKWVIELPENTHWVQWILESTKDHHPYMGFKQVEDLTPYTEPDLEQAKDEAYNEGYKAGREAEKTRQKLRQPDLEQARKEGYEKGLNDANYAIADDSYKKGLSDAWDAARKIFCTSVGELKKIFDLEEDNNGVLWIYHEYTASEAIEKLKAYEPEQEEIKVGDEVISEDDTKGVVFDFDDYLLHVLDENGVSQGWPREDIAKTGRHFPEIAAVLEKMRGEQDG